MSVLNNKVDFVAFISVNHANPNGDPINGNRPRDTMEGFGAVSYTHLDVYKRQHLYSCVRSFDNSAYGTLSYASAKMPS